MHSNFITPPDLVESILIIDADQAQIESCALACRDAEVPYNVYFYTMAMDDLPWLDKVVDRVDVVLVNEESDVPMLNYLKFGENQILKSPADYFAK